MLWLFFSLIINLGAAETPASQLQYKELTSGRYSVRVTGMLCQACARAIAREVGKLKEVQSAQADFETERMLLDVPLGKTLPFSDLRRALQQAAKRVNLETRFEPAAVEYLP